MSHAWSRRAACGMTKLSLQRHFDFPFDSTRRDGSTRWLWRLVRLWTHRLGIRTENNRKSLQLGTPLISFSFTEPASANFRFSERQFLEAAPTPRTPRLRIEILPWNTTDITFDGMSRSRVIEPQLSHNHVQSCRTSKLSHDHGRHDCCGLLIWIRQVHSIYRALAAGMTDVGVGCGALLESMGKCTPRVRNPTRLRRE